MGVSEQTFYTWKIRFAGMGAAELRRVRQLEDENRRLKRLIADLILNKHMLQAQGPTRILYHQGRVQPPLLLRERPLVGGHRPRRRADARPNAEGEGCKILERPALRLPVKRRGFLSASVR